MLGWFTPAIYGAFGGWFTVFAIASIEGFSFSYRSRFLQVTVADLLAEGGSESIRSGGFLIRTWIFHVWPS